MCACVCPRTPSVSVHACMLHSQQHKWVCTEATVQRRRQCCAVESMCSVGDSMSIRSCTHARRDMLPHASLLSISCSCKICMYLCTHARTHKHTNTQTHSLTHSHTHTHSYSGEHLLNGGCVLNRHMRAPVRVCVGQFTFPTPTF